MTLQPRRSRFVFAALCVLLIGWFVRVSAQDGGIPAAPCEPQGGLAADDKADCLPTLPLPEIDAPQTGGMVAEGGITASDVQSVANEYLVYPFVDSAEDGAFFSTAWLPTGSWGSSSIERGGAMGTTAAYTDSPGALHPPNAVSSLEMRSLIDLGSAVRPFLTFWHQRLTAPGTVFGVELWSNYTRKWHPIWAYGDSAANRDQRAWERVEIDLRAAVMTTLRATTGDSSWTWDGNTPTSVRGNAIPNDDDIRIRFRLVTGAEPADGIWVDEIRIEEQTEATYTMQPGAIDNGGIAPVGARERYIDCIDDPGSDSLCTPGDWRARWNRDSSDWDAQYIARSRSHPIQTFSLHDSLNGAVGPHSLTILELRTVIDLTLTPSALVPALGFWTRFELFDAEGRVEIAVEQPGDLSMGYDKLAGWSGWTPVWRSSTRGYRNTAWTWQQIDLRPYAFGQTPGTRIRVRFVIDSLHNSAPASDGWYLDDITFTYNYPPLNTPLTDYGLSLGNWIAEGDWGLTLERNAPVADEGVPDLGGTSWLGILYDCETLTRPGTTTPYDCGTPGNPAPASTFDTILNDWEPQFQAHVFAEPGTLPSAIQQAFITPVISERYGTTGTPQTVLGRAPAIFTDKWTARWTRAVRLEPGTYVVAVNSDDGVRLRIDNRTGTTIGSNRYIVNDWNGRGFGTLTRASFDVAGTASINRVLELRYFENTGDAGISLSITRQSYAFSDSPNSIVPNHFPIVTPLAGSDSSLTLDGYFDLTNASAAALTYQRLYDLEDTGMSFHVEISTDGGFTWLPAPNDTDGTETLTAPANRENDQWEQRTVALPAGMGDVRVRFRLIALYGTWNSNGVWLDDIRVQAS